jgi:large subunit ribosomal protein L9
MKVLLQANVPNLGHIGDLVKVKPGFARNFLLPRGMAIFADERNRKMFEHNMRIIDAKKAKALTAAQEMALQVGNMSLTVEKQVGKEDKIFGTVTTHELAEAFKKQGFEFDRKSIAIAEDIKKVGVYQGSVKLHPEVSAEFKIWVVAQSQA